MCDGQALVQPAQRADSSIQFHGVNVVLLTKQVSSLYEEKLLFGCVNYKQCLLLPVVSLALSLFTSFFAVFFFYRPAPKWSF